MATETGTPNGTGEGRRDEGFTGCSCKGLTPENVEEINRLILSRIPLRTIVSRVPGTSRSALGRHRKHVGGAIVRAVARIVSPPPDLREIERYEDSLLGGMRALQDRTLRLLDDAERDQDGRLRAVAIAQIRENIAMFMKLMPSAAEQEDVPVRFTFPDFAGLAAARRAGLHADATVRDADQDADAPQEKP